MDISIHLEPLVFILILGLSAALTGLSIYVIRNIWAKVFIFIFHLLLYINSGVVLADSKINSTYVVLHFLLLLSFTIAFYLVWRMLANAFPVPCSRLEDGSSAHDDARLHLTILCVYILLCLFPLLYPEMRLHLLLAPGLPDLRAQFMDRFSQDSDDIFIKIIFYLRTLLFPFYCLVLYRYRNRPGALFIGLLAPIYILYVREQYVARGTVLIALLTLVLFYWVYRPEQRRKIVLLGLSIAAPLMVFLHYWAVVRLGSQFDFDGMVNSILFVVNAQISFPLSAGMEIVNSGVRVNVFDYFKWMFTLPIPKILIGSVEGARINYDMAAIVLGVAPGDKGFFVLLPGLVAESVYIGGWYAFWLHAVFLAAVTATVLRILQSKREFAVLLCWFIVFSSYKLVGAGVGAFLPMVVNELLLFYFYVAWLNRRPQRWQMPVRI